MDLWELPDYPVGVSGNLILERVPKSGDMGIHLCPAAPAGASKCSWWEWEMQETEGQGELQLLNPSLFSSWQLKKMWRGADPQRSCCSTKYHTGPSPQNWKCGGCIFQGWVGLGWLSCSLHTFPSSPPLSRESPWPLWWWRQVRQEMILIIH